MKNLVFNFIIILISISAFGQEKYYISFLADDGIPGHAFISIGRESEKESSSVNDGTWGMYPKVSNSGIKELIIGEIPGNLKDDFLRNVDYNYTCEIELKYYNQIEIIILKWKKKNYELKKSDCLTFLIEVANVINDKIQVPKRTGFENLPSEYLKKLIEVND